MCSKQFLELNESEQINYIGGVVILAQSEKYFGRLRHLVEMAKMNGSFDKVSMPDLSDKKVKDALVDVDSGVIENGITDKNY